MVGICISSNISTCPLDDMSDECITDILSSGHGHHDNHAASLLRDEYFCLAAREYVRKHACRKGEPNLTSKMFAEWIDNEYGTRLRDETARRWLAKLGFCRVHHQKGVYFDGHERSDVVACRDVFLKKNGRVRQEVPHSQWQYPGTITRREAVWPKMNVLNMQTVISLFSGEMLRRMYSDEKTLGASISWSPVAPGAHTT